MFPLWAVNRLAECNLTAVLTHRAVKSQHEKITKSITEITWLDYLLRFPVDALPEVIGLGITLITTLLING